MPDTSRFIPFQVDGKTVSMPSRVAYYPTPAQLNRIRTCAKAFVHSATIFLPLIDGSSPITALLPDARAMGCINVLLNTHALNDALNPPPPHSEVLPLRYWTPLELLWGSFYALTDRWGLGRQFDSDELMLDAIGTGIYTRELLAIEQAAALLKPPDVPCSAGCPCGLSKFDEATPSTPDVPAPVALMGRGRPPAVLGTPKSELSDGQYDVVEALLAAYPQRLRTRELKERSRRPAAVNILRTLADSDRDWGEVLRFPQKNGRGGYGIARPGM